MCGIQVLITQTGDGADTEKYNEIWANLTATNSRRGPDAHNEISVNVGPARIKLGAHVLHLRGPHTQAQPLVAPTTGDILCWNGEVFGGLDIGNRNDGIELLNELQRQKTHDPRTYIQRTMSKIEGPYAFVYVDREQKHVWYARDYLGRRSLLTKTMDSGAMLVSSVADTADESTAWTEVAAQKIYCVDLNARTLDGGILEYSWQYEAGGLEIGAEDEHLVLPFGRVDQTVDDIGPISDVASSVQLSDLAEFPDICKWQPYIDQLKSELTQAVKSRVDSIPPNGTHARCGVLFSGGVDCMVLAAILTTVLPRDEPIELFNVAFENPRQTKLQSLDSVYDVPDRKTGRLGWNELERIDPHREWRFIECDVPYSQVIEHKSHVQQLLVPSCTVMDMSIGIALWFASRGHGTRVTATSRTEYMGQSRVLLLGMGADEQLGGYSRHRSAWDKSGPHALAREIALDVERIATRNLGRDDRVVSDNAKEARFPFLAANVVAFLSQTPIAYKMDMRYARGVGEKLLLRLLARQLGLVQACVLAKRAIQFGARTAKMESSQTRGQDFL
ncbi:hypothetical protein IW145_000732 [Coemansia sp. RSA 521]|nr:hypothetical protein GGH15_000238 [Coemansia sp. RSA 562]KAJ2199551.1 hypothetical protein IW144_001484 [Coemansia sp. RSA 522]KAJ2208451.1 hypothetical protein IW145_000732 [Coemansia sp. RSA 521]